MKKIVINCDGCDLVSEYGVLEEHKIKDDFTQLKLLLADGIESLEGFAVTSEYLCENCSDEAEKELQDFVRNSKFFMNGRCL